MYLFGALRSVGKWAGDLVLIANALDKDQIFEFERRGIIVETTCDNPYYAKYNIFSSSLRYWDRLCYMDQDFVIYRDVNKLFEQQSDFLADIDGTQRIRDQFTGDILGYDCSQPAFISSCMLFDTKAINQDDNGTVHALQALTEEYKEKNKHNGTGTDQPILNLYFSDVWKQINGVNFVNVLPTRKIARESPDGIIASHTTRWYKPWDPDFGVYDWYLNGIEHFQGMLC